MDVDVEYEEQLKDRFCPRCQCCDQNCVDGFSGHDCFDDSCCCLDPEDNVPCDICDGKDGWMMCIGVCDKDGSHVKKENLSNEEISK